MIKQFAKLLIVASALSIAALPAISVARVPTCHQEAHKHGIKGKAEIRKYVHECLEKRRHAREKMKHKEMKHEKKMEKKKDEKK